MSQSRETENVNNKPSLVTQVCDLNRSITMLKDPLTCVKKM